MNTWKESIETRPGNFTATAKSKMFISYQTHQDFKITCHSTVDCVKFLLQEGMEYVLTEQFSQDALEEYFGNQRKIGRRSENPDVKEFGYNDNTIRIQRNVSHTSGNTRGQFGRKRPWDNVTNEKVPKKQRNNGRKYKYNNSMTQFATFSNFFFHQQAGYSYYSCTVIMYSCTL